MCSIHFCSNLSDDETSKDGDDSLELFQTDDNNSTKQISDNDSIRSNPQISGNEEYNDSIRSNPQISDSEEYNDSIRSNPQISDEEDNDSIRSNPQVSDNEEDNDSSKDDDTIDRAALMGSISKKLVCFSVMDICTLHPPPPSYRVRDVNSDFVKKLTDVMIEKNSVSVDNAPTLIGFVNMKKSEFKQELLSTYKVYVIDGNHSLKAQRAAYKKTGDIVFKYRGVNIYCDLTEDEALLLGVSRNEDTGSFVSFSDFQKVDLIRRKLYSMTNTPMENDPPKPPRKFKNVFACMLNLHGVGNYMLICKDL